VSYGWLDWPRVPWNSGKVRLPWSGRAQSPISAVDEQGGVCINGGCRYMRGLLRWIICVIVLSALARADQRLVYQYKDDFSQDQAIHDAIIHSIFWIKGAYPPDQPHLTYWQYAPDRRGILLRDHQGQPARIGYSVPVEPGLCVGHRPLMVALKVEAHLLSSTEPGILSLLEPMPSWQTLPSSCTCWPQICVSLMMHPPSRQP
jgi:hypothetical protein